MRIACPYCGERWRDEFIVLGDAGLADRPEGQEFRSFYVYTYLRENVAGRHRELWYHQQGCRQWLVVTRDTRTHDIHDIKSARELAGKQAAS